ncbi:MAG: amidohydrolase family protein [Gammaproteobacteria bacterium]|nr:amidohydrolase family protein [Gammaproteobacteria bacterium]
MDLVSQVALAGALLVALAAAAGGRYTVTEGTNLSVDAAPDGERAVIDLQGRLWVLPLAGGAARPITDGFGDDRLPRWAPHGKQIVFQTFRHGSWDLALVQPDGSGLRALTSDPADEREPAWSADGRFVYYAGDAAGQSDIWRVEVATAVRERITAGDGDEYAPAVAVDGALAYLAERGGSLAVWIEEPGAAARQLFSAPGRRLGAPRFSPDGQRLALAVPVEEMGFPAIARQRLTVVARDGVARRLELPLADLFPFAPAWLADRELLLTADGGLRRIAVAPAGVAPVPFSAEFSFEKPRRFLARSLARRELAPVRGIVEPAALAAGAVVFTAIGDLWRRDADGAVTPLTGDAFVERDVAVSRDGRELAWIGDRDGSMQVRVRDLASGAESAVTRVAGGVRYPVFSPDGGTIAFQQPGPRGDQDFGVRLLDRASGKVRSLRTPPLWPGRMSYTGDGRHLAMLVLTGTTQRSREGVNRLGLLNVEDGGWRIVELPDGLHPEGGAVISPDGRQLLALHAGAAWLVPVSPDGTPAGAARRLAGELADYAGFTPDSAQVLYLGTRGLRRVAAAGGEPQSLPLRLPQPQRTAPPDLLVHAGRLFDGTGSGYRQDVDILLRGGRIVSVRPHAAHRDGLAVIDASARTVLPGLIENHAHAQGHEGEWAGRAWLAYGVTTVVEPGGMPWESLELAESWDRGLRPGPRLIYAGPQLDGARRYFPFASHVATEERLDWELERSRVLGYGLLKTYTRMPPARQAEVIRRGGLLSSSHEIWPALAMGGQRVEHLRGTSRAGFSSKQSDMLRSYGDVTAIVGTPRAIVSPTLVVAGGFFDWWLDHPELARNRQFEALWPAAYRAGLAGFAQVVARRRELLGEGVANARSATLALHRAGARIVAGTDAPIFPYGLSLVGEIVNYVEAGLTPAQALHSATGASAAALGLEREIGSIVPGRLADLVVVDGDPLADPNALLAVTDVIRGGYRYRLEELLSR